MNSFNVGNAYLGAESKLLLVIFRKRLSLIVEKRKTKVGFAVFSSIQNGYWICTCYWMAGDRVTATAKFVSMEGTG